MAGLNKKYIQVMIVFVLLLSICFFSLPVLSSDSNIKIAGQPVFSIISASNAGSVAKRTELVQNNLDNALVAAQDRSPSSVNITYVKGMPVITLGGYQVLTVDTTDATAAHTTPALLASQWANSIRNALTNQASINSYVAQLSGSYALSAPASSSAPTTAPAAAGNPNQPASNYAPAKPPHGGRAGYDTYNNNSGTNAGWGAGTAPGTGNAPLNNQNYRQGRVVYAPAGQIIPVKLETAIATQAATAGDFIQAAVSQNIILGDAEIPAGTLVIGQVVSAQAGRHFTRTGELQIKFTTLRMADGSEAPINAHIVGGIGKYAKGKEQDEVVGETTKNKVGSVAFRGLIGAGGGAALGTAVGAIAGGGYGAGMGAWSGAAIGGGLGAADSLLLRKGKDVTIPSGTSIQLQLDSPVTISGALPVSGPNPSGGGGQQSGGYNQGGGYNQPGAYSQPAGGYNPGGGYNQGSGYGQTGGYNPNGAYNPPAGYNTSQNNGSPIR